MKNQDTHLDKLNSFHAAERAQALDSLLTAGADKAFAPEGSNVNMHLHSFFSYNALGYSPTRVAWESRAAGLHAAGLCDFDVLDGLEEFLQAGLKLGLRSSANLETRAFLKEYSDLEINSPGEPGVTYIMGAGFSRELTPGSAQAKGLAGYRESARSRNVAAIGRVNPKVADIAIDYEKDVLPLTPSGSATERHIITAYVNKARTIFGSAEKTAGYLSSIIGKSPDETRNLLRDVPALEEIVRSKLVKKGGVGYEQPNEKTFPLVDDFVAWVASCDAIPMVTWLDGTSKGEQNGQAMLDCLAAKGCAALNIIPDRNWNIANAETKAIKVAKLNEIVKQADAMGMPVNIGTEMNKLGLPFVDDLAGDVLKVHKDSFIRGARIMVGHTLLLRYAGYSYIGAKARAEFAAVAARNAFFEAVGRMPAMKLDTAKKLEDMGRDKALAWFHDMAK